jgi:hypothetical protein
MAAAAGIILVMSAPLVTAPFSQDAEGNAVRQRTLLARGIAAGKRQDHDAQEVKPLLGIR